MSDRIPVVAAIPNFNMGQQLPTLLSEISAQNYADIFVLDDASTDGSYAVIEDFNRGHDGVNFVAGTENRGAASARNRIIDALGYRAIIHFIDADTRLITQDVPSVVSEIMPKESVGFIGGLALTPEGNQNVWNYGPRQGLRGDISALIQTKIEALVTSNPNQGRALRMKYQKLLADWPDPFSTPMRRQVFWNIEQNLLISSEVFKTAGGFDSRLREHEIQDLAIRLHKLGLKRYFDPSLIIQHKNEQNVRDYNRTTAMLRAEAYIARKQGLRNWLLPNGKFKAEM